MRIDSLRPALTRRRSRIAGLVTSTLLPLPLLLAACGSGSAASDAYVVRDSAGIQIVESFRPAWEAGRVWKLGESPTLHIGVIDGDPNYQFTVVAGLWQTADGSILVVDGRAAEVRRYDPSGRFVSSFGRVGSGPGEFRSISMARPYRGDSILVHGGSRTTVFDASGRIGRDIPLTFPVPEPRGDGTVSGYVTGLVSDAFPDGSLLAFPSAAFRWTPGQTTDLVRVQQRYSAEGEPLDTLFSATNRLVVPDPASVSIPPPYQPFNPSRAGPHALLVSVGPAAQIARLRLDGKIEVLMRDATRDLTMTEEYREAFRTRMRARATPETAPRIEAGLRDVAFPPTVPPYEEILIDSEGHLWAMHLPPIGSTGSMTWSVFAPTGELLGTVRMPERYEVREIGPDYLLGIWTDELDVRYVRKYPLHRGGS